MSKQQSMPNTINLTIKYGEWFVDCLKFAALPVTKPFFFFESDHPEKRNKEYLKGAALCAFLILVIPVIPFCLNFTIAIGAVGIALGIASMVVTYPAALLFDFMEWPLIAPPAAAPAF